MSIISLLYILYLLLIFFIYYTVGKKLQPIVLLLASLGFYWMCDSKYLFVLLLTVLFCYVVGILCDKYKSNRMISNVIIICSSALALIAFIYFKYMNFFVVNLENITKRFGMEIKVDSVFTILIPAGLSFFLLQALGYLIEIKRGNITPEKNIIKLGLFITFFPKLLSGPIEKTNHFIPQIHEKHTFNYDTVREGFLRILMGYFMKVVIADGIAAIINPILTDYEKYSGVVVLTGVLLYSIQIYCDFCGYSEIAIGSAEIFGYRLMENFKAPYLCNSITDFWKRWHISLTSWFRDYIYIPLGGNRKGNVRKYINIMIVFTISGLWHGASWGFVIWGALNGILEVTEGIYKNSRLKQKIQFKGLSYSILKHSFLYLLISGCWIFFWAPSGREAVRIVKWIIENFYMKDLISASYFDIWNSTKIFFVFILSIVLLTIFDYFNDKEKTIREWIFSKDIVFRWSIYLILFFAMIIWGTYGDNYGQTQFIYFQF